MYHRLRVVTTSPLPFLCLVLLKHLSDDPWVRRWNLFVAVTRHCRHALPEGLALPCEPRFQGVESIVRFLEPAGGQHVIQAQQNSPLCVTLGTHGDSVFVLVSRPDGVCHSEQGYA